MAAFAAYGLRENVGRQPAGRLPTLCTGHLSCEPGGYDKGLRDKADI